MVVPDRGGGVNLGGMEGGRGDRGGKGEWMDVGGEQAGEEDAE